MVEWTPDRDVMLLKFRGSGLSQSEAAERLGLGIGAVAGRLRRLRKVSDVTYRHHERERLRRSRHTMTQAQYSRSVGVMVPKRKNIMSEHPMGVLIDQYKIVVENLEWPAFTTIGWFASEAEATDFAMANRVKLGLNRCLSWHVEHEDA